MQNRNYQYDKFEAQLFNQNISKAKKDIFVSCLLYQKYVERDTKLIENDKCGCYTKVVIYFSVNSASVFQRSRPVRADMKSSCSVTRANTWGSPLSHPATETKLAIPT